MAKGLNNRMTLTVLAIMIMVIIITTMVDVMIHMAMIQSLALHKS